jgi:hypothetical protein
VWAEQAVFTSLPRRGRGGYHLVSRSPGIGEADAQIIAAWSPSHGALIVDAANSTSVNFYPLPSGRFALSRTCQGPSEYSGRGGKQLYTHILVVEAATLAAAAQQPFALFRDAFALGYWIYQADPEPQLKPVRLSQSHQPSTPDFWSGRARELGFPSLESFRERLAAGQPVQLTYSGDRLALAECVVGSLDAELIPRLSFATSLVPSSVRPFVLSLVGGS